jgi:hypothetical protein
MATFVIDRATLPEPVSSRFSAPRIAMIRQRGGDYLLSPIVDPENCCIDPADYDSDNDYLNAIPGMRESIMKASASPMSEDVPLEDFWSDDDV